MSYTPYQPSDQVTVALETPSYARAPQFKKAWDYSLLGFVLIIVSTVLSVYCNERWIQLFQGNHSIDDLREFSRETSWLSGISAWAHIIGVALILWSIVLMARGLLSDSDLGRSGVSVVRALKTLKWAPMLALILYLLSLPISVLDALLEQPNRLSYLMSGAAFILLWALAPMVARALDKPSK